MLRSDFSNALTRLEEALREANTQLGRDGAIQRFEFTLDLAWKVVKTYMEEEKGLICRSPKDCFRNAYQAGLFSYSDEWLQLVDLRNETVHTYKKEIADKVFAQLPGAVTRFKELEKAVSADQ